MSASTSHPETCTTKSVTGAESPLGKTKCLRCPRPTFQQGGTVSWWVFFCSPRTNDNVNVAPTAENDRPDDSGILLIKFSTANLYRNVSITRKEKIHEATGLDLSVGCRQHRCRRQEETWVVLISIIQYLSRIVQKNKMTSRLGSMPQHPRDKALHMRANNNYTSTTC